MKPFSLTACLMAACIAAAPLAAGAQGAFPTKPMRIVVPFPPGGSVDPLARVISQKMGETFGQQVIVDNRPGGNTVIGTEYVAKAPADGYTLLLTASSHVTNPQLLPTSYDPIKDFVTVATVSTTDMILVTNAAQVPANNLKEFIALAKSKPGALNFSSAGSGNPNHLAGELLNMMAGIKTTHVPYKGGGPAITDLVGGQVQFSMGSPIIVMPHIRSGKLKALAVSSPKRMPLLPDVPTMSEAGLPGYEVRIWYGLLAPAGTPKDIVAKIGAEVNRIMALPEMKEKLDVAGMDRYTTTQEQFDAVMRSDMDKFGKIIKAANVKLD
ncbi:tripartite tricarboxylate transporter substrate binding protein [Caenimonas aquaedulcis]|uniref:Tripartite tricarboxylate transporter substrate binding protein n=1 Tax=Caenimonas aquaedulcis TaxID=2793270 RepID=A0A931H2K2_9BURK|nr:tripartite tricarboxylate transporter substrate binding protein [Caenimonas aquaedulcis]MBG9387388.1 tripartite tricarboxylate transporter substrate binding protein [Caenimonas aquaedulcis]